jgi:hypothetical protein
MMTQEITITPEYWAQPDSIKYHYARPDGTLWNVSAVNNGIASVWTVNAWGVVYHEGCNVSDLRAIKHETNVEAFDRIRKERA